MEREAEASKAHLSLFLDSRQRHLENRNRFDGISTACDETKCKLWISRERIGVAAGATDMKEAAKAVEQLPNINP